MRTACEGWWKSEVTVTIKFSFNTNFLKPTESLLVSRFGGPFASLIGWFRLLVHHHSLQPSHSRARRVVLLLSLEAEPPPLFVEE